MFTRLFLLYIPFLPFISFAQSAGSGPDPTRWINYAQTYYKIPVGENGIYRITAADLRKATCPIEQLDPTTIQLFHRGVEQAIFVAGEADRHFDADDFLEFYGRGNDGQSDSLLYRPASAQPHSYYSLFSDTTAYFLTWRLDGKPGKRMARYADTGVTSIFPEPYHWADELRLFTDNYPGWPGGILPKTEYSYYEAGEGYTGPMQQKDKPFIISFSLTNAARSGPAPQLELLLAGRDYTNHRVDCLAGPTPDTQRLLDSVRFSTYDNARIQQPLSWSDVDSEGHVYITLVSRGENTSVDAYSLSYIRLQYPQPFQGNSNQQHTYKLAENALGRSLVQMANVPIGTRFWDITDPSSPLQLSQTIKSDTTQLVVRNTITGRTLLSAKQPKPVPAIRSVTFTNWTNRKPAYVIVSHEALMQPISDPISGSVVNPVQAYAAYRASAAGGDYDTLTVTMQQLIDQYNYGERSPLAIRRFVAQLYRQHQESFRYLLLIGRARSTPGIRRNPNQAILDMVMTAGFPGSDNIYSTGLERSDGSGSSNDVPAIPTGRINAGLPADVINYLNKVKEYEHPTVDLSWRKNLLLLSGGQSSGERDLFRRLVDTYRNQAIGESLGARVTIISSETDNPVEQIDVVKPVNEGVGLVTFFGHSGLDVTDVNIGFSSNNAIGYQNRGKYPLLLINGCAIGNFFFGKPTLATDWVLTPNRGAIAAIAHSHLGQPDVMHRYTTAFYSLLTDRTQLNKSIGQLQQETIRRVLAQAIDGRDLANCQQMVLQGDPAIHLFPFTTPDYILTSGGLIIESTNHQPLTTFSDSVRLKTVVYNAGQYQKGPLPVRVRRWVNDRESGVFNLLLPQSIACRDTLTLTFPNEPNAEGVNRFGVTINHEGSPFSQPEANVTNNQATVELVLSGSKPLLVYPPANGLVNTSAIRLTALLPGSESQLFALELDSTNRFDSPFRLSKQVTATSTISFSTTLPAQATTYHWRVRRVNMPGSSTIIDTESWSTSSFRYVASTLNDGLPEGQLWLKAPLPADIQQGDSVPIQARFANLSPYPFEDSLVVQQTIYAAGLSSPQSLKWRVKAPMGLDTLSLITRIDTKHLSGINRVLLTVNPHLQPEYSYLNNTLDLRLAVQPDRVSPLLDVAVDGTRIIDGATISARPIINILLADDNRSLIRRDTLGLNLFLQRPGVTASFDRLSWQGAIVQPTGPDNIFRLQYPLPTLTEGIHQLLVTAQDAVGNAAVPYRVSFRVVNERKLTRLLVYPNPFKDQTLVTFHLTGDRPPSQASLTLTNLIGQVVRQLSAPPRVGINEWVWDGRDNDGNLLPAGIYLYKLSLQSADGFDWPMSTDLTGTLNGRIILIR